MAYSRKKDTHNGHPNKSGKSEKTTTPNNRTQYVPVNNGSTKSIMSNTQGKAAVSAPMTIQNTKKVYAQKPLPNLTLSETKRPVAMASALDRPMPTESDSEDLFEIELDKAETTTAQVNTTPYQPRPYSNSMTTQVSSTIDANGLSTSIAFAVQNVSSKLAHTHLHPQHTLTSSPAREDNKGLKKQSRPFHPTARAELAIPDARFVGTFKSNWIEVLEFVRESKEFWTYLKTYWEKPRDIFLPSGVNSLGNVYTADAPGKKTYFFQETSFVKEISVRFFNVFFNNPENRNLIFNGIISKAESHEQNGKTAPTAISFHLVEKNGLQYITVATSTNDDSPNVRAALETVVNELNATMPKNHPKLVLLDAQSRNFSVFIAKTKAKLNRSKDQDITLNNKGCVEKQTGAYFFKEWLDGNFKVLGSATCDLYPYSRSRMIDHQNQDELARDSDALVVPPNFEGGVLRINSANDEFVCLKPACKECREEKAAYFAAFKGAQNYGSLPHNKKTAEVEHIRLRLARKANSGNFFESNDHKGNVLATSPVQNSFFSNATAEIKSETKTSEKPANNIFTSNQKKL